MERPCVSLMINAYSRRILAKYYAVFRNRSEREIMIASEELRRHNTKHSGRFKMTARKLAEFLQSVEVEVSN